MASTAAKIYGDLVSAMNTVLDKKLIFLGRPDTISSEMTKFATIEIPATITDVAYGKNKLMLNTTGLITLFVKSKSNGTLNVNAMSDLVDCVIDLFPINGQYCAAARPTPFMKGDDGQGFNYTEIAFHIHTKKL